jgi:hypothetical protein
MIGGHEQNLWLPHAGDRSIPFVRYFLAHVLPVDFGVTSNIREAAAPTRKFKLSFNGAFPRLA